MCSCSVVQESMWWNGNQIRDICNVLTSTIYFSVSVGREDQRKACPGI